MIHTRYREATRMMGSIFCTAFPLPTLNSFAIAAIIPCGGYTPSRAGASQYNSTSLRVRKVTKSSGLMILRMISA